MVPYSKALRYAASKGAPLEDALFLIGSKKDKTTWIFAGKKFAYLENL